MTEKAMKRCERSAELLKALSHPVRIQDTFKDRNWRVCELAKAIGVEKSLASKHLSQLKDIGLIEDRKRGTCVECRLAAPGILDMIAAADEAVAANRRKRLEEIQE